MRPIRKLADALLALIRMPSDLEKISRSVDAATAEYKAQNSNAKPAPVVNAVLHRSQSEIDEEKAQAADHKAYRTREEGRDGKRLAIESAGLCVAVILAIANLGLWVVTYKMSETSADSASAAKSSASASEAQARIAEKSVEATIQQSQLDQRPWVYASFTLTAEPEVGKEIPSIDIWLSNSGKTPATYVSTVYETSTQDREPTMPDFRGIKQISQGILPPSVDRVVVGTEPIKSLAHDFPSYINGHNAIYIIGRIDYCDAANVHHWTTFSVFHKHGSQPNVFATSLHNNAIGDYKEPCRH